VSVPSATSTIPVETATALPLDVLPAMRFSSCGFVTGRFSEESKTAANSLRFVLTGIVPPAARMRSITVASVPGTNPPITGDPHRIGTPATAILSLTPTSTSASRPLPSSSGGT
jgi:hypothetical protein